MKKLSLFFAALLICSGIVAQDATPNFKTDRRPVGFEFGGGLSLNKFSGDITEVFGNPFGLSLFFSGNIRNFILNAKLGATFGKNKSEMILTNDTYWDKEEVLMEYDILYFNIGYRINFKNMALTPMIGTATMGVVPIAASNDTHHLTTEDFEDINFHSEFHTCLGFDLDFKNYQLTRGGSRFKLIAPYFNYTYVPLTMTNLLNAQGNLFEDAVHCFTIGCKIGFVKVKK